MRFMYHSTERAAVALFGLLGPPILVASPVYPGVQEFTDKDEWIDAVGEFTTIDFTGFPAGTFITDQYADLGILFTDGNDSIQNTCSHVNDCWGLDGNGDIAVAFDTPQLWIGVDYPGLLRIELYQDRRLFYVSDDYGVGTGLFVGLVSTEPFDAAVLIDALGEAEIDDLHFGPPAPETCPWDLDGSGGVGINDLLFLLGAWGPCPKKGACPADFDDSGDVGVNDLLFLLGAWGPCP